VSASDVFFSVLPWQICSTLLIARLILSLEMKGGLYMGVGPVGSSGAARWVEITFTALSSTCEVCSDIRLLSEFG
jgi:hypothetical protein